VGLVTGAGFAEFGAQVVCCDNDAEKIASIERGEMPIYEPGLEDLVKRNVKAGRLKFTTNTEEAVRGSLVCFIAVPTPPMPDGSTNLEYVEQVARAIGSSLDSYKVVVTKSTVPVGTATKVREWVEEEASKKGSATSFSVASNPEFLREGAAIGDFMRPDRIVIGADDEEAGAIMRDLYRPLFLIETPFVMTNVATAELLKYVANGFLAARLSFINGVANVCEAVGADVHAIARGIGLDRRIGPKFLHAGPGFGGSCLPKDTRSMAHFSREAGEPVEIVEAVIRANDRQRDRMVEKVVDALGGDAQGKTVGVLGLSFKPETDDLRDAPSIDLIQSLFERGARVQAFDPEAMKGASQLLPDLVLCEDAYAVCEEADALVLVTEWNQFRMLDLSRVKTLLRQPTIVDLRNVYEPGDMREEGFHYVCVGRV
jgi:UDPglucose 6-dehydrogenase